jgi:hypothetical protein
MAKNLLTGRVPDIVRTGFRIAVLKKAIILSFLALAAAGLGSLAAEATRGLDESPLVTRASGTTVPPEIVRKTIEGGYAEIEDVVGWLLRNNATTEEAGARAVAVAMAAGRSPKIAGIEAHSKMLDRLRQAWGLAICVPRVFRIDADQGFRPAPGSIAVDFGGADSARMPGFVRVTEKTPNVAGRELRSIVNPNGGALFGDGLEGVEEFAVALDNGTYRITVLSFSRNSGRYAAAPLGYRIFRQRQEVAGRRGALPDMAAAWRAGRHRHFAASGERGDDQSARRRHHAQGDRDRRHVADRLLAAWRGGREPCRDPDRAGGRAEPGSSLRRGARQRISDRPLHRLSAAGRGRVRPDRRAA